MPADKCPICDSGELILARAPHYLQCTACKHEYLINTSENIFIINDDLNEIKIKEIGALEHFKVKTSLYCSIKKNSLIDIGSGSGKFLFAIKDKYKTVTGLEVTPQCVRFSKEKLGLNVFSQLSAISFKNVSLVTAWHSFEHISIENLRAILDKYKNEAPTDTSLLISLPNSNSIQYKLFSECWPYFDSPSHIHQFSSQSLDKLLSDHGFLPVQNFFSFSYTFFGYLQGFANFFNKIHNYFYYRKKRGWTYNLSIRSILIIDLYNYILLVLFAPLALSLCLIDYFYKNTAGVLTRCYRRKV